MKKLFRALFRSPLGKKRFKGFFTPALWSHSYVLVGEVERNRLGNRCRCFLLLFFRCHNDLALPSVHFYDSGSSVTILLVKINEAAYRFCVGAQNQNVRRVVLVIAFTPTDTVNPCPCVVIFVDSPKARNLLTVLPSHGSFLHF